MKTIFCLSLLVVLIFHSNCTSQKPSSLESYYGLWAGCVNSESGDTSHYIEVYLLEDGEYFYYYNQTLFLNCGKYYNKEGEISFVNQSQEHQSILNSFGFYFNKKQFLNSIRKINMNMDLIQAVYQDLKNEEVSFENSALLKDFLTERLKRAATFQCGSNENRDLDVIECLPSTK